jgi:hypothetical protein
MQPIRKTTSWNCRNGRNDASFKDSATGEERQEPFRFIFHLEAQHSISGSGSSNIQKEDILQFARKLVEKIAELHSEGKEINGLALDSEDLKELEAVNHGRLLKSIMAIIDVLIENVQSK